MSESVGMNDQIYINPHATSCRCRCRCDHGSVLYCFVDLALSSMSWILRAEGAGTSGCRPRVGTEATSTPPRPPSTTRTER